MGQARGSGLTGGTVAAAEARVGGREWVSGARPGGGTPRQVGRQAVNGGGPTTPPHQQGVTHGQVVSADQGWAKDWVSGEGGGSNPSPLYKSFYDAKLLKLLGGA